MKKERFMTVNIVFWSNHVQADTAGLLPEDIAEYAKVIRAKNVEDLNVLLANGKIEMVILCLSPTDYETLARVQKIQTQYPDIALIAVLDTMLRSAMVADAMKLVLGYDCDTEASPIDDGLPDQSPPVADNKEIYHLTPRHKDVLGLVMLGKSNKEIARVLDITEGTIKIHFRAIFRELGVANRTEAAMCAKRIQPELTKLWEHLSDPNNQEKKIMMY
jgi:DNA-binding CsgD family transcriptional regulator